MGKKDSVTPCRASCSHKFFRLIVILLKRICGMKIEIQFCWEGQTNQAFKLQVHISDIFQFLKYLPVIKSDKLWLSKSYCFNCQQKQFDIIKLESIKLVFFHTYPMIGMKKASFKIGKIKLFRTDNNTLRFWFTHFSFKMRNYTLSIQSKVEITKNEQWK